MLANKLERTQLQKLRGMPLVARRPPILKRRILYKSMKQRVEDEKPDDDKEENVSPLSYPFCHVPQFLVLMERNVFHIILTII